VYRLAVEVGVTGTVSNGADGVHIYAQGADDVLEIFAQRVVQEAPVQSDIQQVKVEVVELPQTLNFEIVESVSAGTPHLHLTPDLALCPTCRAELYATHNRREGYGFITCTDCGPRFSIAHTLPFDRAITAMAAFEPCPYCQAEYQNPDDRRFYAQTLSCPHCGVEVMATRKGAEVFGQDALSMALYALRDGEIVAVKGIGGYLLLCDATNPRTVQTLRDRKHRPSKPFAVLYPNSEALTQDCHLQVDELAELAGAVSPIVLVPLRNQPATGIALAEVAPGLTTLGVMLPFAPLLELISNAFGKPLVATSGNLSGSPIAYNNTQAEELLADVADVFLHHNRQIVVPQDDSVIRFTPKHRQRIVLRRGRGLAPSALLPATQKDNVLALGASLKSTFSWAYQGVVYVSPYLGNLESLDVQANIRAMLVHFTGLLRDSPKALVADAHLGYFSTQLAQEMAHSWGVPLTLVQHHQAHFAAVLAEHPPQNAPVLGVVWDGTGFGTDGHIWGGEFFLKTSLQNTPKRVAHFAYFDALLGDKMPKEPRFSAFSLAREAEGFEAVLQPKFSTQAYSLYSKLIEVSTLKTSSVGRLFDAVASLLGLVDVSTFEGEAGLMLEQLASTYTLLHRYQNLTTYLPTWQGSGNVPTQALFIAVLQDLQAGVDTSRIAANFHFTLVDVVAKVARNQEVTVLAFSGGVFQNALLVDLLIEALSPEFTLLFHQQCAPNDESISVGQLFVENRAYLP
jgi:hydrogenase maturation protein HypF